MRWKGPLGSTILFPPRKQMGSGEATERFLALSEVAQQAKGQHVRLTAPPSVVFSFCIGATSTLDSVSSL